MIALLLLAALPGSAPLPICHAFTGPSCRTEETHTASGQRGATDTLGRGGWLIDEENDEVLLADALGVRRRLKVGAWPEQLLVDASGRVFVSCRQAGRIDVIGEDFRVQSIPIGPEPRALALDDVAHRLYVGTVTGRQLVAFDTRSLTPVAERRVELPVTALAVTPYGLAVASDRDPSLRFYATSLEGRADLEPLGEEFDFFWGGEGKQEFRPQWLQTDGDSLFVVSRATATGQDAPSDTGGYGGGMGAPHQLVVHEVPGLSKGLGVARLVSRAFIEDPSSVALAGRRLFITSRSRGVVFPISLDEPAAAAGMLVRAQAEPVASVPEPLVSFSEPTSLDSTAVSASAALEDGRVLLLEPNRRELSLASAELRRFEGGGRLRRGLGSLTRLPARFFQNFTTRPIAQLPESRLDRELRLGKALFHDANNSRSSTRRMACANCHIDGREDGLVWEQNATFRQTPMLAGGRLADTAPYNWLGTAKTLEANIANTVRERLQGSGLKAYELAALSRYLREGLRPVQRPLAAEPQLIAQGKEIFESPKAACATCHPSSFAFTDGLKHDVQSVGEAELKSFDTVHGTDSQLTGFSERFFKQLHMRDAELLPRRFNTPALAYLGVTAPYLHDGSAASLEALIKDNHNRMGTTSHLNAADRRALVAYLQSL